MNCKYEGCKNLESVYIPSKVSTIGGFAFWGCENIIMINVRNTTPPQMRTEFFVDLSNATLYVPVGCRYAYYIDPHWGNIGDIFEDIVEVPDNGDANADGNINVSDVTSLVNMILGVIDKDEQLGDVNGDGQVNVSDVAVLVNLILGIK